MSIYNIKHIMHDVRVVLDRNMESRPLMEIGDVDTLSQNEIILSKIVEAVRLVHTTAQAAYLDGEKQLPKDICHMEDRPGAGYIVLPDDFMRLVVFRMSDWRRGVYQLHTPDDEELFAAQSSPFAGIRGTTQRPVCFMTLHGEGRTLEFYSSKNNEAYVSEGTYMPLPHIDHNGGIEISKRCYRAVVYQTAALALTAMGDKEKQSLMSDLATQALT